MCVFSKSSPKDLEMESEEPTSTMVAAPPPAVKSKRSLIGHGWMEIASEGVKVSNCSLKAADCDH